MGEERAALYTRGDCATQQTAQRRSAIASQLEALRNHAATRGMKIIGEFTDDGYSGLRLNRRGLGRMRDRAGRRGFDVLLAWGPDRLARSVTLQRLIVEELEGWGVKTVYLDRGTG
jgi:DNA invertase Pin-like site-specific DNA recombinase